MDICWLSGGNYHVHPFPLSAHTALMLLLGIREYDAFTDWMFESGIEGASYCRLRTETAIDICRTFREWVAARSSMLGAGFLEDVDELLCDLSLQRRRFASLVPAENAEYERLRAKMAEREGSTEREGSNAQIDLDEVFSAFEDVAKEQRARRGMD